MLLKRVELKNERWSLEDISDLPEGVRYDEKEGLLESELLLKISIANSLRDLKDILEKMGK